MIWILADLPEWGGWALNVDPRTMFQGLAYAAGIDGSLAAITIFVNIVKSSLHPDDDDS